MKLAIMSAGVLVLAGCATKIYPKITPLSDFEAANMTCEDLAEASAEADLVEVEIKRKARVDVDAITGVLIDGGIRNALAHDESKKELKRRRSSIDLARAAKGC